MSPSEIRAMANRNGGTIVGNGEGMPTMDMDGGHADETKPLMIFVELVSKPKSSFLNALPIDAWADNDEGDWTKIVTTVLATQYRDLLHTGGLSVTCYDVGDNKILVSSQKGWHSREIVDFFLEREEVKSVTIDGMVKKARGGGGGGEL